MPHTSHVPPAKRLLYETVDFDAARDQVVKTFSEHDMAVENGSELNLRIDLALAPRLAIGKMSYGATTVIDAPAMRTYYEVNLPLSGHSTVSQNGARRTSRAGEAGVALRPVGALSMTWSSDQEQYVIKLRKEQLETHAAKLAGRVAAEPLDFDLSFDLTSGAAQALLATAAFVHAELIRPDGLACVPAACHELESVLMTQVLTVVPSQLSPLLHTQPSPLRRTRIHEALDLIDADPAAMTTGELAAKVGVSARALQAGFQEVVGTTPTSYIRGLRLDRVHYELLRGTDRAVTDVAMDWGFFHPGRFAQQYRGRFGILPSETARSHRAVSVIRTE